MKKIYLSSILASFLVLFLYSSLLHAQAFRKGSLLISLSEGSTWANVSTTDMSDAKHPLLMHQENIHGARDPIIIEYGITSRWSLGLSSGTDFYEINPYDYYGFKRTDDKKIKATTGEFNLDGNYHFLVTKKLDLSAFVSLGFYSVSLKEQEFSDSKPYVYKSNGGIYRTGLKARYYFFKHFGVFGMYSVHSASSSPKDVEGNTVGQNYSTKICGNALEAGLCFKFLK